MRPSLNHRLCQFQQEITDFNSGQLPEIRPTFSATVASLRTVFTSKREGIGPLGGSIFSIRQVILDDSQ